VLKPRWSIEISIGGTSRGLIQRFIFRTRREMQEAEALLAQAFKDARDRQKGDAGAQKEGSE
jgi:hypothetical protein